MPGPWEKYGGASSGGAVQSGPWQKYAEAPAVAPPAKAILDAGGPAQTALESAANTSMLGYLPHAQAGLAKLMDPSISYVQERDSNIKRLAAQSAENPKSSMLGTGAGIGASLLIPGAAIAKGAGLAAKLGQGAKMGALYGAAANPGDVEGELSPVQLEARGKNAAVGAGIGAAGTGLADLIGRGASRASGYFKGKGEEKAFKATGAMLRDFRKAHGKDKVQEIGRQLLDEDVVTPLSTHKTVAERAALAVDRKGKEIEGILDDLGSAEQRLKAQGQPGLVPAGSKAFQPTKAGIDRAAIAKSLRDELISANPDIPGIAAKNAKIDSLIREFEEGGGPLMGLIDTEMKKRATGQAIKWDRLPGADIPIEEQVQRALYTKLKQGVEDGATALESLAGGPSKGRFKAAKDSYGNLETAAKIAKDRVSRDAANRAFGLTDTISGGAGATVGALLAGPWGAAAGSAVGGAANKLGRTFGNSLMATGFDATAKQLAKVPGIAALATENPRRFQALVAAIRGGGPLTPSEADPLDDPDTLEIFRQNPGILGNIKDPERRAEIERRLGRAPGGALERKFKPK